MFKFIFHFLHIYWEKEPPQISPLFTLYVYRSICSESSLTSDLSGLQLYVCDPGWVHQWAWPPQRVDDALPLRRQTHIAAGGDIKGRVDAVLEVLRC